MFSADGGSFNDPFGPPAEPRLVECLHCGQCYLSDYIRWDEYRGLWRCPVPDCDGCGYGFDILDVESVGD